MYAKKNSPIGTALVRAWYCCMTGACCGFVLGKAV